MREVSVTEAGGALTRIEVNTERGTLREDFRAFQVLDSTPEHRALLEMSPHPGARVVNEPHGELPRAIPSKGMLAFR